MRGLSIVTVAVLLGGCSTTIEQRSQLILVNTNPPGADWIACVKPGYQQATYFNHLGVAGATVGNIILGDTMYDSPVNITMVPNVSGQPEGPTTLPASFAARPAPPGQQPPR
jgi:hypothetical protein